MTMQEMDLARSLSLIQTTTHQQSVSISCMGCRQSILTCVWAQFLSGTQIVFFVVTYL